MINYCSVFPSRQVLRCLLFLVSISLHQTLLSAEELTSIKVYYRMNLNQTNNVQTADDALDTLESDIMEELTTRLQEVEDNVQVKELRMEKVVDDNECPAGYSDICAEAFCHLVLNITGDDENQLYEYATVAEVELYLEDFNSRHENVMLVEFLGPLSVYADVTLRFDPVTRPLNDEEEAILEAGVVQGIDQVGDAVITNAVVYIQELRDESTDRRRGLQVNDNGMIQPPSYTNYVGLRVQGRCERGCDKNEFSSTYRETFQQSIPEVMDAVMEVARTGNYEHPSSSSSEDEESIPGSVEDSNEDTHISNNEGSSPQDESQGTISDSLFSGPLPSSTTSEEDDGTGNEQQEEFEHQPNIESQEEPEEAENLIPPATATTSIDQSINDGYFDSTGYSDESDEDHQGYSGDGAFGGFSYFTESFEEEVVVTSESYLDYSSDGGTIIVPHLEEFVDPLEEDTYNQSVLFVSIVTAYLILLIPAYAALVMHCRRRSQQQQQNGHAASIEKSPSTESLLDREEESNEVFGIEEVDDDSTDDNEVEHEA